MKSIIKLGMLLVACFISIGCSNSSSNSLSSSNTSSELSSSMSSQMSVFGEEKTLEQFEQSVSSLTTTKTFKTVRLNYHIVEKVDGSVPKYLADGNLMEDGVEYISDFSISSNDYKGDSTLNYRLVSGEAKTNLAKGLISGQSLHITSWLSYHSQRRNFLKSAQEGEGFEEKLCVNPYTMWMTIWGVRPANATMEGSYFGSEEYLRTYDKDGYATSYTYIETMDIDGTLISWNNPDRQFKGHYVGKVTISFEYLTE